MAAATASALASSSPPSHKSSSRYRLSSPPSSKQTSQSRPPLSSDSSSSSSASSVSSLPDYNVHSGASSTLTTPARSPFSTSPLSPRSPLGASISQASGQKLDGGSSSSKSLFDRHFSAHHLVGAQAAQAGGLLPRDHHRLPTASLQPRHNSIPGASVASLPTSSSRTRSSMPDTSSATASSRSSQSHHSSQQWWQHVLPPGQLAERLRRAQLSSSRSSAPSSEGVVTPHDGLSPISGSFSRADRAAWTNFAPLDKDSDRRPSTSPMPMDGHDDSYGSAVSSDDHGDSSASPPGSGSISPRGTFDPNGFWTSPSQGQVLWPRTAEVPLPPRFKRSTSVRRSRVMSDDGHGAATLSRSKMSKDPRENIQPWGASHLKRPSSSAGIPRRDGHGSHISGDEGEASHETITTSTAAAMQHNRSSSLSPFTLPSDRNSLSVPPDRLSALGRAPSGHSPRSKSVLIEDRRSREGQSSSAAAATTRSSHSSARTTPHQSPSVTPILLQDTYFSPHARSRPINRTRMPIRSAPGSRRGSFHADDADRPHVSEILHSRSHTRHESVSYVMSPEELIGVEEPDMALLQSLGVAQKQMASASNLTLTLTRQLSAPLRPFIHLAVLMCISTVTFGVLACFLTASYALTGWDDLNRRSSSMGQAAGTARRTIEAGVDWGRRMLTGTALAVGDMRGSHTSVPSTPRTDSATVPSGYVPPLSLGTDSRRSSAGHTPSSSRPPTTAGKEAPTAASPAKFPSWSLFSIGFLWRSGAPSNADHTSGRSSPTAAAPPSSSDRPPRPSYYAGNRTDREAPGALPPRPPLSMLLPSIAFTIILAVGAGLASFIFTRYTSPKGKNGGGGSSFHSDPNMRRTTSAPHGTWPRGHSPQEQGKSEDEEILDDEGDFYNRPTSVNGSTSATSRPMRRGPPYDSSDSLRRSRRSSAQPRGGFKHQDVEERIMC